MTKSKAPTPGHEPPTVFECEDKNFSREPAERHSFSARPDARISLIAPPGRGKSGCIKNWACHGNYRVVFVAHGANTDDGQKQTKEYDLIDHTAVSFETHGPDFYIQQSEKHDGGPMLLICDDLDYAGFSKTARANMYKVCQFVCTHYRMTMLCSAHSWPQLVPRVRRLCDVHCIWPCSRDQVPYIARGLGTSKENLARAFSRCKTPYDFVVIERGAPTWRSAWRINGHVAFTPDE